MTEQEHKLTPTERLHDLAMAAITREKKETRGLFDCEIKQGSMGPMAQVWHVSSLRCSQLEDETPLEWADRVFELAQHIQRHCVNLNAGRIRDELEASTEPRGPKAVK